MLHWFLFSLYWTMHEFTVLNLLWKQITWKISYCLKYLPETDHSPIFFTFEHEKILKWLPQRTSPSHLVLNFRCLSACFSCWYVVHLFVRSWWKISLLKVIYIYETSVLRSIFIFDTSFCSLVVKYPDKSDWNRSVMAAMTDVVPE